MSEKAKLDSPNNSDSGKLGGDSTGDTTTAGATGDPGTVGTGDDGGGNGGGGDNSINSDRSDDVSQPGTEDSASGTDSSSTPRGRKTNIFGFGRTASPSFSAKQPLSDEERREKDRLRKQAERARNRAERGEPQPDTRAGNSGESEEGSEESGESSEEGSQHSYEVPPRRINYNDILEGADIDDSGMPKGIIAGTFKALFALPAMAGHGDFWRISDKDAKDLADGLSNALATMPKQSKAKYEKYLKNYFPWIMLLGALALLLEERVVETFRRKKEAEQFANQGHVFNEGVFGAGRQDGGGTAQEATDAERRNSKKAYYNRIFRNY